MMKYRILLVGILSLIVSQQLIADLQPTLLQPQETEEISAVSYFKKMQLAYKQLNYELLYLDTRQNKIEPNQFIHGLSDGKEITYFRNLNGVMREFLQFENKISYYEQGVQPYSLLTQRDQGVFSNLANFDFEQGTRSYEYIIIGKQRIAGHKSIAIRMISKDEYRYNYIVWIELESFLPVRLDTINQSNMIVEQVMVVSLNVTETINPWISQLVHKNLPEPLQLTTLGDIRWDIGWLPTGFKVIKDNRHKLMMRDALPVSYIMINDGMVTTSVYITMNELDVEKQQTVIQRGATLLYTMEEGALEVTIIGEIPLITAEKIAASIRLVK